MRHLRRKLRSRPKLRGADVCAAREVPGSCEISSPVFGAEISGCFESLPPIRVRGAWMPKARSMRPEVYPVVGRHHTESRSPRGPSARCVRCDEYNCQARRAGRSLMTCETPLDIEPARPRNVRSRPITREGALCESPQAAALRWPCERSPWIGHRPGCLRG